MSTHESNLSCESNARKSADLRSFIMLRILSSGLACWLLEPIEPCRVLLRGELSVPGKREGILLFTLLYFYF